MFNPDKFSAEQRAWWDAQEQRVKDMYHQHPPGFYSLTQGDIVTMVIVGGVSDDGRAACALYDAAYLTGNKLEPGIGEWTAVDWEHLKLLSINEGLKDAWYE